MKLSGQEVADILEGFLEGRGGPWAWDDFISGTPFEDKQLEEIRKRCDGLGEEFPPANPGEYCNEQGRDVIRTYIKRLKRSS